MTANEFCSLQQCRNIGCSKLSRDKDLCMNVTPPRKPSTVRRGTDCEIQTPHWSIKDCRAKKCEYLKNTSGYGDAQERCHVFGEDHSLMPGTLTHCIQDLDNMPPEEFLRHVSWSLKTEKEQEGQFNRKIPGPKNCPESCPYKISRQEEVKGKTDETGPAKKPKLVWSCAFNGGVLGHGMGGSCDCHVLDNPEQDRQIETIRQAILHRYGSPFNRAACDVVGCPDGITRCKAGDILCPVVKVPFIETKECPLWRIPAKLLPKSDPIVSEKPLSSIGKVTQKEKTPSRNSSQKEKPAPEKKTRKKKEPEDLICTACRERMKGNVPDHACAWCKEEQLKFGRRAWVTGLELGTVHSDDMERLGKEIPDESVDLIFTDPPYIDELYEEAYDHLARLAARVLKPGGFLITYAPQAHLDEIMDLLRYSREGGVEQNLQYFWIIQSLNLGPVQKAYKWNALCKHKPILVFQKAPGYAELKGARRCFSDVVNGYKQKRFHAWQQSVHDVLGIIDRFMVPGEILLDPFAGWGTSLIAANLLGMQWIGIEIQQRRQAIAMQRLQQQPLALEAFGIEAPAAECEREPVEAPKDTSKQSAIEPVKISSRKRSRIDKPEPIIKTEPADPATEARPVDLHAACLDCEAVDRCLRHDPHAGCLREFLDFEKAVDEAKEDRERNLCRSFDEEKEKCIVFKNNCNGHAVGHDDKDREVRYGCYQSPTIPSIAWCQHRGCQEFDHESFICITTGKKIEEQTYCPTQHLIGKQPKPSKRPKDAGTGGGPQPFVQKCCGTCGHHKGRKTFHESCPRLGELLFKGGTKSARVLMDETASNPCESWTDIPGDLYTTVYYDGKDLSPSLGTCPDKCPYKVKEKSSCGFTDQQFLRMESCPTGALQSSPEGQKQQLENMARALARLSAHIPSEDQCQCFPCPDGVIRCGIGDKCCPFSKNPFYDLALCPMTNPRRVRQILRERPLKFVKIEKQESTVAEKPNCGGKRPAISRCPDNCPDRSIEKEGGYPQGRCKQTGQKLREMQACPNDPPKKSASKKSKKESENP